MASNVHLLEKGRISSFQLAFLNVTVIIATSDVFLPAFVAQEANQDAWISVIIATIAALPMVYVGLTLCMRYPDKTIVQFACDILGKPLGKALGLLYVYINFFTAHAVTRELGEVFTISFNPMAPVAVFCIFVLIVAAYAVYKGLETIAKLNDILLPIGIFVLAFIGLININTMDFKYFMPILYKGLKPVFKGALLINTWLIETFVVIQLIPYVRDKQNIRKSIYISVIVLGFSMMIGVLTISVLGPLASKVMFPALQFVKYATIGPYIENLDISIMVVWISGIFVKIALSYYLAVLTFAQLFELKAWKTYIYPLGLLIISFSVEANKNVADVIYSLHYVLPFFFISALFIIPLILLVISIIRDWLNKQKTANGKESPNDKSSVNTNNL